MFLPSMALPRMALPRMFPPRMFPPRMCLRSFLACATLLVATACQSSRSEPIGPGEPGKVAGWMCGIFTSADQAERDPENFFAVRLVTVPIWKTRTDGPWLYVEQAMLDAVDAPYRQRVYRLVETEAGLRSEVYSLPRDGEGFAGIWMEPGRFSDYNPEMLTERSGCAIELERSGSKYLGSTVGEGCASSLRGASYATSEVTLSDGRITSWDRGFDAEGRQVWGAESGPYEFKRVAELY
jgi:CpeT protein